MSAFEEHLPPARRIRGNLLNDETVSMVVNFRRERQEGLCALMRND